MTKNLYYTNNEQGWKLENQLKTKGYKKTADCYHAQIFQKNNKTIILNRA